MELCHEKNKHFWVVQNILKRAYSEDLGANIFVISAQKMKFSINDFFNKCDRIRSFLNIMRESVFDLHHIKVSLI